MEETTLFVPQNIQKKKVNSNDEWYTPLSVIERVKFVMGGIDLDPASCEIANQTVQATEFFTKESNSLNIDWHGRVFMNPPYSNANIGKFTRKIVAEYERGRVTEFICLTNIGTDTKWNQVLTNFIQAFTLGRISFDTAVAKGVGGPSRGQCFTYGGPNYKRFLEVFNDRLFSYVPNAHMIVR